MDSNLVGRSVAERMFTRESTILNGLLNKLSTPAPVIQRHLVELSARWITLQEKHDLYVCEFVTDMLEISANDALIDKYSCEFVRLELACHDFQALHSVDQSAANSPTSACNSIKLERVKFRTFDGDLRKYPKFKSEFELYVQPLCQQNQLPFVLKSYLCDSVRRLVDHIDHDIAAMWNRLDERYGTVQKQVDYILSEFKDLPACSDPSSTLQMISVVELAEADLKCMNASNQLENSLIISYIENSMSKEMLKAWAEIIANDSARYSSETKFPKLMDFLKHWRWLIEYNEAPVRKPQIAKSQQPQLQLASHNCTANYADIHVLSPTTSCSVNHADVHVLSPATSCSDVSTRKCLVHPHENHPVWHCRAFNAMTPAERHAIVKSKNACTHCLVVGHSVNDCKKTFRCTVPECRSSTHNVLLHNACSAA